MAIGGGTDADDGLTENLDFVGKATNPGLYYANNGSYVFFRMRVDADIFTTSSGAYLLLLDVADYGVTGIDYAFMWDAKSRLSLPNTGLNWASRGQTARPGACHRPLTSTASPLTKPHEISTVPAA
jgi:hypothetical protein